MHKNIFIALLLSLFLMQNSFSQCDTKGIATLTDECYSKLGKYKYLQSFELKKDLFKYGGEKIEFRHFLSKGNNYLIILNDYGTETNKMYVEIYDSHKKLVATSYDKNSNKFFGKILFPCKSSETYYFKFAFNNNVPSCGIALIGFADL